MAETIGQKRHALLVKALTERINSDVSGFLEESLESYRRIYDIEPEKVIYKLSSYLLTFYSHYAKKELSDKRIVDFLSSELAFKLSPLSLETHILPKVFSNFGDNEGEELFSETERWLFLAYQGGDGSQRVIKSIDESYVGRKDLAGVKYTLYALDKETGLISGSHFHLIGGGMIFGDFRGNEIESLSYREAQSKDLLTERFKQLHFKSLKHSGNDLPIFKHRDLERFLQEMSVGYNFKLNSYKASLDNRRVLERYKDHPNYADFHIDEKTLISLNKQASHASYQTFFKRRLAVSITEFRHELKRLAPKAMSVINRVTLSGSFYRIFNYINDASINEAERVKRREFILKNRMFIHQLVLSQFLDSDHPSYKESGERINRGDFISPLEYLSIEERVGRTDYRFLSHLLPDSNHKTHRYGNIPVKELLTRIAALPTQLTGNFPRMANVKVTSLRRIFTEDGKIVPLSKKDKSLAFLRQDPKKARVQSIIEPLFHIDESLFPTTRKAWKAIYRIGESSVINHLYSTTQSYKGLGFFYREMMRLGSPQKAWEVIHGAITKEAEAICQEYYPSADHTILDIDALEVNMLKKHESFLDGCFRTSTMSERLNSNTPFRRLQNMANLILDAKDKQKSFHWAFTNQIPMDSPAFEERLRRDLHNTILVSVSKQLMEFKHVRDKYNLSPYIKVKTYQGTINQFAYVYFRESVEDVLDHQKKGATASKRTLSHLKSALSNAVITLSGMNHFDKAGIVLRPMLELNAITKEMEPLELIELCLDKLIETQTIVLDEKQKETILTTLRGVQHAFDKVIESQCVQASKPSAPLKLSA